MPDLILLIPIVMALATGVVLWRIDARGRVTQPRKSTGTNARRTA